MTAGLVLISYAQGTNFPKIVWLGVALDVASCGAFSAHLRAALAWPRVMGLKPTLPIRGRLPPPRRPGNAVVFRLEFSGESRQ